MHNAPSVSYPTGRSVVQQHCVIGLALCTCAVTVAWALQGAQALQLGVCGVSGALAAWLSWRWLQAPAADLVWDGEHWLLHAQEGGVPGRLRLCADAQHILLLRWDALSTAGSGVRTRWLWLARSAAPAHWLALRRAVVQHTDTQ